jgi:hypothetical protein
MKDFTMEWRNILGFVVLFFVATLLWMVSRGEHRRVNPGEAVYLPQIFSIIFGSPATPKVFNIRGIYGQIFTIYMVISVTLFNPDLTSRKASLEMLIYFSLGTIAIIELLRRI